LLEFDTPQALLSNVDSQFSSLVKQTGLAEAGHLRMIANGTKSNGQQNEETVIYNEKSLEDASETDPLLTSPYVVI
jgi:hypothetical protein